jgi:arginyl-tRNA synthetase
MNSIFRKLRERDKTAETALHALETAPPSLTRLPEKELADTWDLVTVMSSIEEDVARSVAALEFSHLARFAFTLCQNINSYYHRYPILSETDPELRNIRLLTISAARRTLGAALALMGIPIPEKM